VPHLPHLSTASRLDVGRVRAGRAEPGARRMFRVLTFRARSMMQYPPALVVVARGNGISRQLLRRRLELGWPPERAAHEAVRPRTTIPAAIVAEIRARRLRREPCRVIARELGVSRSHVADIAAGVSRKSEGGGLCRNESRQ